MIELSVIVPTFNEKENIIPFLEEIETILKSINVVYEIIFIDDNSPDNTWKVIEKLSENNPNLKLIRRFQERGLSSAVIRGMETAKGKYFLIMDVDLQHDPKIIPQMLNEIQTNDVVIASRNHKHGSYGNFSNCRRKLSLLANYLSQKILSYSISDPMSGYFMIKKEIFYTLAPRLNPRGFKILLEILGKSKNLRIAEVGYSFRTRKYGKSKLNINVIESYFLGLLEIVFGNLFSVLFTRYALVGISGVFVNLTGQWIGNLLLNETSHDYLKKGYFLPSLAVAFGFLLSVIHNFYWNNVWTFVNVKKQTWSEIISGFFIFLLVSGFGFFIQISVWRYSHSLLSSTFSSSYLTYFCNLFGIFAATIGNYYLNKNLTWKIK